MQVPPAPDEQPASLPRRVLRALGPGLVSGAADDDPSGIATYSVAGAQQGTALLWTALLTWPLMAAVQMMCARIGMVTGIGLAGALGKKFSRPVMIIASVLLALANTINVAADLSGMADAAQMLTGVGSHYYVVGFAGAIGWATIELPYRKIASVLKWLTLSLFAYVGAAFMVHVDWASVVKDTFLPSAPHGRTGWATLVAILGTTISPYLFFWQASQEVEEEKGMGRATVASRQGASREELANRQIDVGLGTAFSNLIMFFVIVTTAFTLHRHGLTNIETSRQAAEALVPLAGRFAASLYTAGIVGVGALAIPTLTGSAAYALAETFGWEQGLNRKLGEARYFYAVVVLSTLAAVALDFTRVQPVRALFWSAVINGVLAPFLLVGVLLVGSDSALMQGQPSSTLTRSVVAVTVVAMFAATIGMVAL
jgi:NRAMP (natural resistance-associated macrophage protein)-like metal ion transporter